MLLHLSDADNILKGFAASFSIVTSCILCYFFFDFEPNLIFVAGAVSKYVLAPSISVVTFDIWQTLVNISMYIYSMAPAAKNSTSMTIFDGKHPLEKV